MTASELPNEALARAVMLGGESGREAEAELCRRFAPRVRLYGLRHLRDSARADDLVQTVLIGVLSALRAGRVDDLERFERYVLGTCRNTALRMLRSAARFAPEEQLPELEVHPREPIDDRALITCMGTLGDRAQQVLMMSFHAGEPAEAIALALDTTAVHVRVLRHRALAALRKCLELSVRS